MQPGDLIGRYRLESALGEGGMKRVWRARDLGGERDVALAVVRRFDPTRFANELALARRVASPHVAAVLDGFVTPDGVGVVVSELCEGLDLAAHRQAVAVAPGDAVALIAQLASGLVAIHAAHVLHRDVKPANAILTAAGVKVIDFGISLPAVDARTGVGGEVAPAGTLPYMAPEAFGGEPDARSDTYALGVSLHELVTGRLPLPRLGPHQWIDRLRRAEPLPAVQLDGVDRRVRELFVRLCDPVQARRPFLADVEDELHALAAALGGAVPSALPPAAAAGATLIVSQPTPLRELARAVGGPTVALHVPVAVPDPRRVVVGWPHLPLVALVPDGGHTRVRGFDREGRERLGVHVADDLRGGLVADLDGDGVGELYAWSATRVHVVDAAGRVRLCIDVPPHPGVLPWDDGAPAPVVLEGGAGRELGVGGAAIDPVARSVHPLPGGWEGRGDELVDAHGTTGMSCHGAARQRFRGDVATPAAILAPRRGTGFVVASLERIFDGRPTVGLGLWGPGGRRVGGGTVGQFALQTAPYEMYTRAQLPDHRLFGPHVAPLAVLGGGAPSDDAIVVPFLHNAPWFGPVLVGFDGTGAERWRERVAPLMTDPPAPPILVDLDGGGHPELLWSGPDGGVQRRDARTGAVRSPLAEARGTPIAALDPDGSGHVHLLTWSPDALQLTRHGPCLPGAILWLPTRGDLWRSGTVRADGMPVGPTR